MSRSAAVLVEAVEVIRSAVLGDIAHGFCGRMGGVSHGLVAGLNVGLGSIGPDGDNADAVTENRARAVAAVLPGARLATVYQVHSADCVTVVTEQWDDLHHLAIEPDALNPPPLGEVAARRAGGGGGSTNTPSPSLRRDRLSLREPPPPEGEDFASRIRHVAVTRPHADAMVTDHPGLLLGILTADCAPVLLVDRAAGVIGAAHAGWKGALAGVTDQTVAAMVALGADVSRIAAAIGPCIAQASYEVDDGFRARFLETDDPCFSPGRSGHWQFDLAAYVAHRLHLAGVATVDRLGLDTYAAPQRFFSFRRATHRGEPAYGRQIALIGL